MPHTREWHLHFQIAVANTGFFRNRLAEQQIFSEVAKSYVPMEGLSVSYHVSPLQTCLLQRLASGKMGALLAFSITSEVSVTSLALGVAALYQSVFFSATVWAFSELSLLGPQ